jgi:KDO2-lipid IV(A) lauroyltransferase
MRVIAMAADQTPIRKEEKYWASFLNQDTPFYVGLEKLARITKYPVYFASARRTRRGHYEATMKKIAEPPYGRDDENAIIEQYARETERVILEDPPNWLWSHKRWKYKKPLYG